MDFIFMLTRDDVTVPDCLEVYEAVRPLGLRHVGFKDVGADSRTLGRLVERIKAAGATSYLEIVSAAPEASIDAAREAAALGVDRLLGGTDPARVRDALGDAEVAYYPFCGAPEGHPTALRGSPDEIETHCAEIMALGCAGADLLAYRSLDADPVTLANAARKGLGEGGGLIVAGSVDSPARIRAMQGAGVDAVTVGSAVFELLFAPGETSVRSQLQEILAAVE